MQNMFLHLFLTESERVFVMFAAVAIIMLQPNLYDLNLERPLSKGPAFNHLTFKTSLSICQLSISD